MEPLAVTLQRLEKYRLPLSFGLAQAFLRSRWQRAVLLALYQHYFPAEFALSTTAKHAPPQSENLDSGLYNRAELDFLRLVDQNLFPLGLDLYQEQLEEECQERMEGIYVISLGLDWWQEDFYDLSPGWQFLLVLTGLVLDGADRPPGELSQECREALDGRQGRNPDWEKFKQLCGSCPCPLPDLPLALDLLDHDTGNIYLDSSDEVPAEPLDWCVEDMDFLAEQYREAVEIRDKIERVIDWLEEAGQHNMKEVVALWNRSLQT